MSVSWDIAAGTDIGRIRRGNEDAFHVDPERGVLLVADGMGGHAAGEVASEIAARTAGALLAEGAEHGIAPHQSPAVLRHAFLAVHQRIVERCSTDPQTRGMGTTLTVCLLDPQGTCRLAHIGDSRAYRLRGGRLEQLTRDHTWVQREIDRGRLPPTAADTHPNAHVLTRVLSEDTDPEPDVISETIVPGDVLLLSSDGLHGMLKDEALAEILGRDIPLPDAVTALIAAANARGGADNITVVLARVRPGD